MLLDNALEVLAPQRQYATVAQCTQPHRVHSTVDKAHFAHQRSRPQDCQARRFAGARVLDDLYFAR